VVGVASKYTAVAYKGGAVMLKEEATGLRITFDRSKGMMFVDYPQQLYFLAVAPVMDELTSFGIRAKMQSAEELEAHHARFILPKDATTNNHFRMIISQFVGAGVLGDDASTALHNCLLNEEGKPPASSPPLGK
jgi:hypothetical protein